MSQNEHENKITPEELDGTEEFAAGESMADSYDDEQVPMDEQPKETAADTSEADALRAEMSKYKDQMLRAMAETENVRRRAVKDREDAGKFAISGFAKDLLDFSDNFKRALDAIPEEVASQEGPVKAVLDGIGSMEKELLRVFDKHGIEKIEPEGQVFDPNFHEVMFEAPMPGAKAGQIIQVIEPGYILKGRLLRPARVGVARDEGQGDGNASGQAVDTEA